VKEATDATDLEQLYRDQGDRLWRAILAYAGDRRIADDAVAEASRRRSAVARSSVTPSHGSGAWRSGSPPES
jgi:hypothetical protein